MARALRAALNVPTIGICGAVFEQVPNSVQPQESLTRKRYTDSTRLAHGPITVMVLHLAQSERGSGTKKEDVLWQPRRRKAKLSAAELG